MPSQDICAEQWIRTPFRPSTGSWSHHLEGQVSTDNLAQRICSSKDSPQNGMQTPEMESIMLKPPIGSGLPGSHSAICLSLILEKPVVAKRLCSPIHTALLFFAPAWPGASWTGCSWRTSQTRIFLSREVVTSMLPLAFHDKLCTMSLCLSVSGDCPVVMSQSLTVKSPEADARMFSAEGLKRTCPTFLCVGEIVSVQRRSKRKRAYNRHLFFSRSFPYLE